jgi:hypothetical protein
MKYAYLFLVLAAASAACLGNVEGNYENYQNYQVYAGFFEQFQKVIGDWNNITKLQAFRTGNGNLIYIGPGLNMSNVSCSNRMAPTFDCQDILLEYQPKQEELAAGDVVSFFIYSDEAKTFGEEMFSVKKTIQRRIFRVGNDSGIYYIMKKDSSETTHNMRVPFDRITGRVIGFLFNSSIAENPNKPYTSPDKKIEDYNMLVDNWNAFVGTVYAAKINGGSTGNYPLFYEKGMSVQSLACTGSMKPTIDCNDIVFAYKPLDENDIHKGDVVSFRIAPNETAGFLEPSSKDTIHVMHRVFRITKSLQNETAYITKGDNPESNAQTDAIYLGFPRIETKMAAFFKDSYNITFSEQK